MQARITIAPSTVKALRAHLAAARAPGDQALYARVVALLLFAQEQPVRQISQLLGIAESTFYT